MNNDIKIDNDYILGKIVSYPEGVYEYGRGRIIATEINGFDEILITVECINGGDVKQIPLLVCSFEESPSISELKEALREASKHRDSIVQNISYASQISGEDISIYKPDLEKWNLICEEIGRELKNVSRDL